MHTRLQGKILKFTLPLINRGKNEIITPIITNTSCSVKRLSF